MRRMMEKMRGEMTGKERLSGHNPLLNPEFWRTAGAAQVDAALKAGADIGARDQQCGLTPLHWAAVYSNTPTAVELLLNKAELEAHAEEGGTPLHYAAAFSTTPEVVERLLDHGAELPACDKYGFMPLHVAARFSAAPEVVELLLARGAEINARAGKEKWTPLHEAARHSAAPAVIALLLARGADGKAKDYRGRTPFDRVNDRTKGKGLDGTKVYRQLDKARY